MQRNNALTFLSAEISSPIFLLTLSILFSIFGISPTYASQSNFHVVKGAERYCMDFTILQDKGCVKFLTQKLSRFLRSNAEEDNSVDNDQQPYHANLTKWSLANNWKLVRGMLRTRKNDDFEFMLLCKPVDKMFQVIYAKVGGSVFNPKFALNDSNNEIVVGCDWMKTNRRFSLFRISQKAVKLDKDFENAFRLSMIFVGRISKSDGLFIRTDYNSSKKSYEFAYFEDYYNTPTSPTILLSINPMRKLILLKTPSGYSKCVKFPK